MFKVQGIDHVGLAVKDVQKSVAWYQEMLGLERIYEDVWGDFPGVVDIGDTSVALFPTDDPAVPLPAALPEDHKIAHSIYFYDPAGCFIEFMTYDLAG